MGSMRLQHFSAEHAFEYVAGEATWESFQQSLERGIGQRKGSREAVREWAETGEVELTDTQVQLLGLVADRYQERTRITTLQSTLERERARHLEESTLLRREAVITRDEMHALAHEQQEMHERHERRLLQVTAHLEQQSAVEAVRVNRLLGDHDLLVDFAHSVKSAVDAETPPVSPLRDLRGPEFYPQSVAEVVAYFENREETHQQLAAAHRALAAENKGLQRQIADLSRNLTDAAHVVNDKGSHIDSIRGALKNNAMVASDLTKLRDSTKFRAPSKAELSARVDSVLRGVAGTTQSLAGIIEKVNKWDWWHAGISMRSPGGTAALKRENSLDRSVCSDRSPYGTRSVSGSGSHRRQPNDASPSPLLRNVYSNDLSLSLSRSHASPLLTATYPRSMIGRKSR